MVRSTLSHLGRRPRVGVPGWRAKQYPTGQPYLTWRRGTPRRKESIAIEMGAKKRAQSCSIPDANTIAGRATMIRRLKQALAQSLLVTPDGGSALRREISPRTAKAALMIQLRVANAMATARPIVTSIESPSIFSRNAYTDVIASPNPSGFCIFANPLIRPTVVFATLIMCGAEPVTISPTLTFVS